MKRIGWRPGVEGAIVMALCLVGGLTHAQDTGAEGVVQEIEEDLLLSDDPAQRGQKLNLEKERQEAKQLQKRKPLPRTEAPLTEVQESSTQTVVETAASPAAEVKVEAVAPPPAPAEPPVSPPAAPAVAPPLAVPSDEIGLSGELLRTPAIPFEPDTAELAPDAGETLNRIARYLNQHPELELIRVEGYAEASGRKAQNLKFAQLRAQRVRNYLVQLGISGSRLLAVGVATANPIDPARRVEFLVARGR